MTLTMDFANDLMAGLRGTVHAPSGGAATRGFDWPGLHARLAAAHAARRELTRRESSRALPAGGFAAWRSTAATTGKTLPRVNLTDLADGKAPAGMESVDAGIPGAGGRGKE